MDTPHLIDFGKKLLDASNSRERLQTLASSLPVTALAALVVAKSMKYAPMRNVGGFVAGTLAGAGAVVLFAPGGDAMRKHLSERLGHVGEAIAAR